MVQTMWSSPTLTYQDQRLPSMRGSVSLSYQQFPEALEAYTQAIELDGTNMSFVSNRAAVYFEQKDYEACINEVSLSALLSCAPDFFNRQSSTQHASMTPRRCHNDRLTGVTAITYGFPEANGFLFWPICKNLLLMLKCRSQLAMLITVSSNTSAKLTRYCCATCI